MIRLPDLSAWAIFARTVEAGSFAKAAEIAGVSQPTISKAISRLENRLGTNLLNRSPRGFSLTAAGEAVLEKASLILEVGQAAEEEACKDAGSLAGLVRVAAPASFGTRYLTPLLPAFLDRHPGIEIEVSLSDYPADLFSGDFDLAVRSGVPCDSSLRMRKLCSVRQRLVASPDYLARHGVPRHPDDLHMHQCLVSGTRSASAEWRFRHISGEQRTVAVKGRLRVDNSDALSPALLAGSGLVLRPEFLVRDDLAAGRVEEVLPDWLADDMAICLVTPPTKLRPARVSALMDYLGRRLSSASPEFMANLAGQTKRRQVPALPYAPNPSRLPDAKVRAEQPLW